MITQDAIPANKMMTVICWPTMSVLGSPDRISGQMRVTPLSVLVLLAFSSPALAKGPSPFPSGNSAGGQYREVIPTADGGRPSSGVGPGRGSSSAVSPSTAKSLARLGPAGPATAALARATAPTEAQGVSPHRGASRYGANPSRGSPGHRHERPSNLRAPAGGPPASQLVKAVSGSDSGMGVLLPIILGATALVAITMGVFTRRRRAT
jgi:hypothetical protein